jgi:small subunit ribosomal protein S17
MADETENTETTEETPEAVVEETTAEETPTPEAPAEPEVLATPKERRAQRRAVATAKRGPRRASTPEAREAERKRKAKSRTAYRARAKAKKAELPQGEVPEPAPKPTGQPKVRQGIVVSSKADKTITVRIDVARRHRRYQKTIRSSTTLHAHDEKNDANEGDTVSIIECRPLSRLKRWRLVDVVERAR